MTDINAVLKAFPVGAMRCNGFDVGAVVRELISAPTPPQPIYSVLNFVCTALPGPGNECAFVELENDAGESLGHGEWRNRDDGLVELHIAAPQPIYDEAKRIAELERALAGMLFAFDDGVGRDWSADLLDFARKLTPAVEFQSRAKAGEAV